MRIRSSARARIVLTVTELLAFSTIVSAVALRQILLARVDDRIEAGLAQEVAEFRRLAAQTGLTDVRQLFDQFLVRDIPDQGEASFTFVGEAPYRSNADLGTDAELLDRARASWVRWPASNAGTSRARATSRCRSTTTARDAARSWSPPTSSMSVPRCPRRCGSR
jgi:hypothetical protein